MHKNPRPIVNCLNFVTKESYKLNKLDDIYNGILDLNVYVFNNVPINESYHYCIVKNIICF